MIYYLSLGANLGEREQTIRKALSMIEQQIGPTLRCSTFYYSPAWGFESQNEFCNLCCSVETDKNPLEVLHLTQAIEKALGRTQKSTDRYADRLIDIDLIRAFDQQKEIRWNDGHLTLPHKLWQQRDFVKIPLSQIFYPSLT